MCFIDIWPVFTSVCLIDIWPVFTSVCCMLYLYDFICPILGCMVGEICVWSMCYVSCLSGLGCPVCLGYLSFLPTSYIANVLCTCNFSASRLGI